MARVGRSVCIARSITVLFVAASIDVVISSSTAMAAATFNIFLLLYSVCLCSCRRHHCRHNITTNTNAFAESAKTAGCVVSYFPPTVFFLLEILLLISVAFLLVRTFFFRSWLFRNIFL